MTPEAQKRAAARREARERPAFGPEDRGVGERCILGFNAGPPMLPSAYNNNVQLVQTSDYVVIHNEMVHNARVVPLDQSAARPPRAVERRLARPLGRRHAGRRDDAVLRRDGVREFQPTLQLTERFTRVDADTLIYEFTVNDPTTWTKPWTAQVPMTKKRRDDVRVRVPRGQLRHDEPSQGRPLHREGCQGMTR